MIRIKEAGRLLTHLQEEVNTLDIEDYRKGAKKTYFKINVSKGEDKRAALFVDQLARFVKCINQVSNIVKKSQNIEQP
jgi:IS5 family transposase